MSDDKNLVYTRENRIYFNSSINQDSFFKFIKALEEANLYVKNLFSEKIYFKQVPKDIPIEIYITSQGGGLHYAFAMYDLIRDNRYKVNTIVNGIAASGGALVAIAGDERSIYEHSVVLWHQLTAGGYLKIEDLKDTTDNMKMLDDMLVNILFTRTNLNKEEAIDISRRERYINAQECLEKGIVTQVI